MSQTKAIVLLLGLDQLIKLSLGWVRPEWLIGNRGVAFGLTVGYPAQLTAFLTVLLGMGAVYYLAARAEVRIARTGALLFFLGGLSNVIDRMRTGYVVDYLPIGFGWRVNLGDLMIIAGCLLLIGFVLFPRGRLWLSPRGS